MNAVFRFTRITALVQLCKLTNVSLLPCLILKDKAANGEIIIITGAGRSRNNIPCVNHFLIYDKHYSHRLSIAN